LKVSPARCAAGGLLGAIVWPFLGHQYPTWELQPAPPPPPPEPESTHGPAPAAAPGSEGASHVSSSWVSRRVPPLAHGEQTTPKQHGASRRPQAFQHGPRAALALFSTGPRQWLDKLRQRPSSTVHIVCNPVVAGWRCTAAGLGRAGVGRDAVGEAFPGMLLAMLSQPCFDKTCRGRCGRPQQSAMKNSAWLINYVSDDLASLAPGFIQICQSLPS
jgi:hypothetical protein